MSDQLWLQEAGAALDCTEGVPSAPCRTARRRRTRESPVALAHRLRLGMACVSPRTPRPAQMPVPGGWLPPTARPNSGRASPHRWRERPWAGPWGPELASVMEESGRTVMQKRLLSALLSDPARTW